MSASIAVIGGSGFIGTELVAQLMAAGSKPSIFDIAPSARFPELWHELDVRDANACERLLRGYETVVNLAAVHRDDVRPRRLYYETNVDGARALCDAASRVGVCRIVFTSSVAVYGNVAATADESWPIRPVNDYGRSKALAEEVYREWSRGEGRSLIIVRPVVVFGVGNRGNVATLIRQIATNHFIMVGKGTNRKSMAAVENVCAFLVAAVNSNEQYGLFNYADAPPLEMNALVRIVRRTLGRRGGADLRLPYWVGMAGGLLLDLIGLLIGRSLPVSAARVRKFCASTSFGSTKAPPPGYRVVLHLENALSRFVLSECGIDRKAGGDTA